MRIDVDRLVDNKALKHRNSVWDRKLEESNLEDEYIHSQVQAPGLP